MNNKSTRVSRMKYYIAAAVLMASFAVQAAGSPTNCLAIYLVDTKIFHTWPTDGNGNPDSLKTISPPVLSDSDFVSFDTTNYTFVVTATAAKRLARSIWDLGKQDAPGWDNDTPLLKGGVEDTIPAPAPFVLKAMGRPIYSGAFFTMVSSSSFGGPVILPDVEFIGTNSTRNVSFRIELGYPVTFSGTVQADTGLNVNDPFGFSSVPDPRGDIRIKLAVEQLFAHDKK